MVPIRHLIALKDVIAVLFVGALVMEAINYHASGSTTGGMAWIVSAAAVAACLLVARRRLGKDYYIGYRQVTLGLGIVAALLAANAVAKDNIFAAVPFQIAMTLAVLFFAMSKHVLEDD